MVRAIYHACLTGNSAEPGDVAWLKIYYPAVYGDSVEERNTGLIPAKKEADPFPVAIMLPGINVGPESYGWLAQRLAEHNTVVVTYAMIGEEMPGYVSLTPGLDIDALRPEQYGQRPSATALSGIIEALHKLNENGVLCDRLHLGKLMLFGHSGGGSVALLNADPDWFPGIVGCISYAAHTGAATVLGHPENTVMALPSKVPTLIMGGNQDGVIANSAHRYAGSSNSGCMTRLEQTFSEGISSTRRDSYLIEIDGANHFSIAWPEDATTGRPFLDYPTTQPDAAIRDTIANLALAFISSHINEAGREQIGTALTDRLVANYRCV